MRASVACLFPMDAFFSFVFLSPFFFFLSLLCMSPSVFLCLLVYSELSRLTSQCLHHARHWQADAAFFLLAPFPQSIPLIGIYSTSRPSF